MGNKYIELEKKNKRIKSEQEKQFKHLNLGLVVYIAIFAYLIFCVLSFSLSKKVNYTVAEIGSIVESETFNGLIIKNEVAVSANLSGYSRFFIPEGEKVKKGSYVSLISETKNIEDLFPVLTISSMEDEITEDNYTYIKSRLRNYVLTKNDQNFDYNYSMKSDLNKAINDMANTVIIENLDFNANLLEENDLYSNFLNDSINLYEAPVSGVVSYSFDGFEDMNIDNFTIDDLYINPSIDEVLTSNTISQGNHIFKIVDNYEWYIAAEINSVCENEIKNKASVELNFYNQKIIVNADIYSIFNDNNNTYAIFKIDRYMGSFLTERFIDFTITYDTSNGIKIPNSCVVESEFISIPIDAFVSSGNSKGVNKQIFSDEFVGGQSIQFVKAKMYTIEDEYVYATFDSDVNIGDVIEYSDGNSTLTYALKDTVFLEGVYVINKGYPVFRLIETVSTNEDYRIIEENTSYGVMMYDRIMSDISANEIK
jgi:hypothetical protein